MNVLIVGAGGREHALAWKITQSPRADHVFVAPGNAGTDLDGENVAIEPSDFPALIRFAKENDVGSASSGPRPHWPPASSTLSRKRASARSGRTGQRGTRRQQSLLQKPPPPRRRPHGRLSGLRQSRRRNEVSQGSRKTCRGGQGRRLAPARASSSVPAARRRSRPSNRSPGKKSSAPPAIDW